MESLENRIKDRIARGEENAREGLAEGVEPTEEQIAEVTDQTQTRIAVPATPADGKKADKVSDWKPNA